MTQSTADEPLACQDRRYSSQQVEFGILLENISACTQTECLSHHMILMDIGLPKLNGLEAARQIRELPPAAKLIFLTQEE
jgi:CheY-like chemotaxis protein